MLKYRLSSKEVDIIVESIKVLDKQSQIFLYGSRVNPHSKGGDIDLLIISEMLTFSDKINILVSLKEKLGDQKIDLTILNKNQLSQNEFFKEVSKINIMP